MSIRTPPLRDSEIDEITKRAYDNSDFKIIKDEIQSHLTDFFKTENYSQEDIKEVRERLYKMIDYAIKRYDDYSGQRHRFLTLGIGIIGVSATLFAALINKSEKLYALPLVTAGLGLLILLITGITMLVIYSNYTTADYPYRKIMDIHSWYFKYKFSDGLDYKLSKQKERSFQQVGEATKNYLESVYRWVEKSKVKNYFIKEDIEQVAILQLLQKYGRDCVEKMKNKLVLGVWLFIIFLALTLILQFIMFLISTQCKTIIGFKVIALLFSCIN